MLMFASRADIRMTGMLLEYISLIGYLPLAPLALPCDMGSSMRLDSRYTTTRNITTVPTSATMGFGWPRNIVSYPPFIMSDEFVFIST